MENTKCPNNWCDGQLYYKNPKHPQAKLRCDKCGWTTNPSGKDAIRLRLAAQQNGKCAITGKPLLLPISRNSIMRVVPPAQGGGYEIDNLMLVIPVEQMKWQGNWRGRTQSESALDVSALCGQAL
jgi:hypothetical protein